MHWPPSMMKPIVQCSHMMNRPTMPAGSTTIGCNTNALFDTLGLRITAWSTSCPSTSRVLNYCPGEAGCSNASNDAIDRHSLRLGPAALSSVPSPTTLRGTTMNIMLNVKWVMVEGKGLGLGYKPAAVGSTGLRMENEHETPTRMTCGRNLETMRSRASGREGGVKMLCCLRAYNLPHPTQP